MPSVSPPQSPPAPHSILGKRWPNPPALSATVPPPAFPPLNPKCSTGSIGPPDPLPSSDGRDWAEDHLADAHLPRSRLPLFSDPAFPSAFPPVLPELP